MAFETGNDNTDTQIDGHAGQTRPMAVVNEIVEKIATSKIA